MGFGLGGVWGWVGLGWVGLGWVAGVWVGWGLVGWGLGWVGLGGWVRGWVAGVLRQVSNSNCYKICQGLPVIGMGAHVGRGLINISLHLRCPVLALGFLACGLGIPSDSHSSALGV